MDNQLNEAVQFFNNLSPKMRTFCIKALEAIVNGELTADDIENIVECKRNGMSEDETVNYVQALKRQREVISNA